jgi:hypothetical protein
VKSKARIPMDGMMSARLSIFILERKGEKLKYSSVSKTY